MSELADKVDLEIGNDTEQARINFLKYINYGRQLGLETLASQGTFTKDVVDKLVADQRHATALEIFEALDKLEVQVSGLQADAEKVAEDEEFESLKRQSDITKPEVAAAIVGCERILSSVDEKHTRINRDVKAPAYQSLKDKYLA